MGLSISTTPLSREPARPHTSSARWVIQRSLEDAREWIDETNGTIVSELKGVASTVYCGNGTYRANYSERRTLAVVKHMDAYHEVGGCVIFYGLGVQEL
jgi:hypothetical protein